MSSELRAPGSWGLTNFGHVFKAVKGKKPKSLFTTNKSSKLIPYIDIKAFSKKEFRNYAKVTESRIVEEKDVVIVWDGSRSGLVGHSPFGALGSTLGRFPKNKNINNNYFFHFLNSKYSLLNKNTKGAGIPHLNPDYLNSFNFPLPPEKEQDRIVKKIEACFSRIEKIEVALKEAEVLLSKYRESLLAKAFRGELVPQNPTDEPASELLKKIKAEKEKNHNNKKQKELPPINKDEIPFEIPESWEWVRLGEFYNLRPGYAFKSKDMQKTEAVQIIKIANVSTNGFIDKANEYVPSNYLKEHPSFIVEKGNLLIALTRPVIQGIFKTGFYNLKKQALLNQRLAVAKGCYEKLNWLFQLTKTKYFVNEVISRYTGTSQPNLSHLNLELILIPISSKKEQIRIVKKIESSFSRIKKIKTEIQNKLTHLKKLKESILNNAFQGKLVPQIPEEGTGHELLAKILKEKELEESKKQLAKKKTTKKKAKGKKIS